MNISKVVLNITDITGKTVFHQAGNVTGITHNPNAEVYFVSLTDGAINCAEKLVVAE